MCKFQTPNVPQGATADERRAIMFNALSNLDLSDKCEKRESLTYLSWANAWSEFKSAYPSATYRILKNENGLPYFSDPDLGIMVFTEVTVDDVTHHPAGYTSLLGHLFLRDVHRIHHAFDLCAVYHLVFSSSVY